MHKSSYPKAPLFLPPPDPSVPFHQAGPLSVLRAHSIKGSPHGSRNPYRASYYVYVFGTVPEIQVTEMKSTFFPLRVQSSGGSQANKKQVNNTG